MHWTPDALDAFCQAHPDLVDPDAAAYWRRRVLLPERADDPARARDGRLRAVDAVIP